MGIRTKFGPARLVRILAVAGVFGLGLGIGIFALDEEAVLDTVLRARSKLGLVERAERPRGHWTLTTGPTSDTGLTAEQQEVIRRLQSLGYAGGTQKAPTDAGVTAYNATLASGQLRYYTSGHGPDAFLMGPEGHILHRWRFSYSDCIQFSGERGAEFRPNDGDGTAYWRRAHLLPGGEMLAIFEGHGLAKIDRKSRLLWSYSGNPHHDLDFAPDGSIYVLTCQAKVVPEIHPKNPVLLDYITHLSADGEELDELDLYAAFANSAYASLLSWAPEAGDIFHTNTLERLDGKHAHLSPIFTEGNFLISVREMNTVAIVDPETRLVVWALAGMWIRQHQPTLLDNGHILLFDNQGHGGRSKVIEFDPLSQRTVWMYDDAPVRPLYSKTCGSVQRLPNGNTVITESNPGRIIEVTPEKKIVWEFRNPHRAGENDELIAAVMEMVYLSPDYSTEWLDLP